MYYLIVFSGIGNYLILLLLLLIDSILGVAHLILFFLSNLLGLLLVLHLTQGSHTCLLSLDLIEDRLE